MNFLCPHHVVPRLSKVKYLDVDVKIEIGRMLKRSVGKIFVLKIDLVYFDLGALFQIPRLSLLSLNRLNGPDNVNKSMTLSILESQTLVSLF